MNILRTIAEIIGWAFVFYVTIDYLLELPRKWKYGVGTLKEDHGYWLIKPTLTQVGFRWVGSDKLHVYWWLPFRWYTNWGRRKNTRDYDRRNLTEREP